MSRNLLVMPIKKGKMHKRNFVFSLFYNGEEIKKTLNGFASEAEAIKAATLDGSVFLSTDSVFI